MKLLSLGKNQRTPLSKSTINIQAVLVDVVVEVVAFVVVDDVVVEEPYQLRH